MDDRRALSRAKHEGVLNVIPAIAEKALAALRPVGRKTLLDRLTLLGMSMIRGLSDDERGAWLHETARLLSDFPERILFEAIDECIKEPGRVFAPTVGEVREKAAGPLRRAEIEAANLQNLARLIAEGVEIAEYEPPRWSLGPPKQEEPWKPTPGETDAILAEYGLKGSAVGDKLAGMLKPETGKSRTDIIAEGRVPPSIPTRDDGNGIYV